MTRAMAAYDKLMLAYDARDKARLRVRQEVDRMFAPVIAKRHAELEAARHGKESAEIFPQKDKP